MAGIPKPEGLDWVKLHEDMDKIGGPYETTWDRIKRKSRENPLVPFGCSVTVFALTYGLYNFIHGRSQMQQRMMRLRVGAQLFTVVVAVGGLFMALPKEKRTISGLIESGEAKLPKKP